MAVALASIGATSDGTTSLATDFPASIASSDLLLQFIASKFNTSSHSTPTDFTLVDGDTAGVGSEGGSDSGSVVASAFSKIATGSESGTSACTITSGNVAQGMMARITRSGGSGFDIVATTARWNTDATNPLSVTFDDAISFAADDYCVILVGLNTNGPTNLSSLSVTASGITFGTPTLQRFTGTSTGGDMTVAYVDAVVSSGSGTVTPSFEATKNGSSQGEGPLIFIRIREAAGGGGGEEAALTGTSATTAVGNVTPSIATALAGVAATSATGALTASTSQALTGTQATGEVGATVSNITVSLTGVFGAVSVGTVSTGNDVTAALAGVVATASVGSVASAASYALSGVAGSAAVGDVTVLPPVVPTVTLRLFATPAGSSVVASATGIEWAWYDDATTLLEALADTPTVTGSGASSDASGYLSLTLTGSTKNTGERGFLLFSDCTGAEDENPRTFGAMVEVD